MEALRPLASRLPSHHSLIGMCLEHPTHQVTAICDQLFDSFARGYIWRGWGGGGWEQG